MFLTVTILSYVIFLNSTRQKSIELPPEGYLLPMFIHGVIISLVFADLLLTINRPCFFT